MNLVGVGLLGLLVSRATFAADAKVAVIDTIQAQLALKLNARQAVASALDDLGVAMVPLEDITPEDGACSESDCFAATAKRVGASHLLLVSGVANPAGYRLMLDLRDGSTGRSLATDGKECELCAEDQFAPTLRDRVTGLWKRVAGQDNAAAMARTATHPAEKPEEDRPPEPVVLPPFWSQRTPVMGLAFAAVGLVGIGFGVYYVAVDGAAVQMSQPTNLTYSSPIVVRDTGKWGWTFIGVGAVSFLAGSAMVIWGREDGSNVTMAIGPGSLGLQGKY
jgi:hypothetical protein